MRSLSASEETPTSSSTCRISMWLSRPSPELSYLLNRIFRWCNCERFSWDVMHAMAILYRCDCKCWWCKAAFSDSVCGSCLWAALAFASQPSLRASAAEGRMPSSLESSCWQNQRAPRPHLYFASSSQFGCRRGLQTACACIRRLSPRYGSSPVIIWKTMTPRLHTSLFAVKEPLNISGDMYEGVPPTRVLRPPVRPGPNGPEPLETRPWPGGPSASCMCVAANGAAWKTSAMPKSASMTCTGSFNSSKAGSFGLATSSALSHFKSLWITPATSCAYARALRSCEVAVAIQLSVSASGRAPNGSPASLQKRPWTR
mmetsp:Transcript_127373/g.396466  ORF Transcript_127373/g.396466 Transcript_127373/m.396466 type:complete len:315 (+) Transcript_127373:672-1616(+)